MKIGNPIKDTLIRRKAICMQDKKAEKGNKSGWIVIKRNRHLKLRK